MTRADVLLVIGARLGEMTTSAYSLVDAPVPRQALVHVHGGAEELGRVYRPALAINSGMAQFFDAVSGLSFDKAEWRASTATARKSSSSGRSRGPCRAQCSTARSSAGFPTTCRGRHHRGRRGQLRELAAPAFPLQGFRTQLGPTNGSMGYGYPAAVAAKLAASGRTVFALCGDGDFLMNGQEIATAVQYCANFVAVVVNNGLYGTIRMHQEREYPGRVFGTALSNPDFSAYARAFGGHGETVERTADFAPAYERAVASGKPALIELRIDPDAITPAATLSAIREKALKSKR